MIIQCYEFKEDDVFKKKMIKEAGGVKVFYIILF